MVFNTYHVPRERVYQNPGDCMHPIYTSVFKDDGTIQLEESGKEDVYQFIQSHRDSVDIHVLLAQYRNGDKDALNKRQTMYLDATQLPHNYAEVLQAVMTGEDSFKQLPIETRAKFEHNFGRWLALMGTDDWYSKMGITPPSTAPAAPDAPTIDVTQPVIKTPAEEVLPE